MTNENYKGGASASLAMPCGNVIDLARSRSRGVLTREEVSFCRDKGIPLAYDPTQIGWLPATVTDDLNVEQLAAKPARRTRSHSAIAHKPQINALHPQYRLRAWKPYDLPHYRALLDDPLMWQYMPEAYPDPLTNETAAALIELSNASNHHQVFAVLRDSRIVGQVRLLYDVDDTDPGKAEISYWLGRAFWGKGIGSDVVALFTARCFTDNPSITTLIARVHKNNPSSAKVLAKAGYAQHGTDHKDANWIMLSVTR
ncbi:GNAT family N-acetyltransferase [uncultured Sulfitobacter sp.]|uniref:GNAT family N-acetyltransferase n=1 Tax=uncultured Sulfitobacter sp. TaxID=191468 RepID=UPI0026081BB0|nr:GNAT family N-acetyltransferase [uncultured Sulfitobacter sp.]